MRLTKKTEAELLRAYNDFWTANLTADMDAFASYLVDDFSIFGSANGEIFFSKQDAVKFYTATADQMRGKAELRNRNISLQPLDTNSVIVREESDLYVLIGNEWTFYGHVRISCVVKHIGDGWKALHQHASFPDHRTEEGQQLAAEKIEKENLELREAVKRRTVELEHKTLELAIEAALERVRAVAMGMRKPDDMLEVCQTIAEQLEWLKVKEVRNVQTAIIYENKGTYLNYEYYVKHNKLLTTEVNYNLHPEHTAFVRKMLESPEAFYTQGFAGKELKDWYAYQKTTAQFADAYLEQATSLNYYMHSVGGVVLGMSTYTPLNEEEINLFKRFRNVFDLAYRRFVDIEKAEAQAREAQIQLALERVRARTMAMQQSNELADAAVILFQQVKSLGIETYTNGFNIWDEERHVLVSWMSNPSGVINPPFIMPAKEYGQHKRFYEAWKNNEQFIEDDLSGKKIADHYKYLRSFPLLDAAFATAEKAGIQTPNRQVHNVVFFSHGYLLFVTLEPKPEFKDLFKRFGQVFQQTYTRFLDLQKAEAQAREAQIQLALERVRARTMAMQKSNELLDVISIFSDQLMKLNISFDNVSFGVNEQGEGFKFWFATAWQSHPVLLHIPYINNPAQIRAIEAQKKGLEFFADTLTQDENKQWIQHILDHSEFRLLPDKVKNYLLNSKGYARSAFILKNINLYIGNYKNIPYTEEENSIFKKFAQTFQQSYTRFLDLQKAEAQAREAQVELSLERIRAQALAMRESTDLLDIVVTMRTEFVALGHEAQYFWHMRWQPDKYEKAMTSGDGTRIGMVMELPRHIHGDIKLLANWEKSDEPTVIFPMGVESALNYVDKMITLGDFKQVDPNAPSHDDIRHIGGLTFIMARTTLGEIGYSLPGVVTNPPAEDMNILVKFAGAFDLAHKRFEDLKRSEEQAKEVQVELALEKVRSRSMGMQKSEELKEVIKIVYQQLTHLKINLDHAGFVVEYKPKADWHFWIADKQEIPSKITHPYFESVWANQFNEAKEKGTDFFATRLNFEEKNKFYKELLSYVPGLPEASKDFYLSCPGLAASTVLLDNVGLYIENFSGILYTDEENKILMRFGKVFQQTYTRFLDLQKAEAQAREAQIEAALERVRSRTMAMQTSEELADAAYVLFEQLNALGVTHERINIGIVNEATQTIDFWVTEQGGEKLSTKFSGRISEPTTLSKSYQAWKKGEKSLMVDLKGEDLQSWLKYMSEEIKIPFNKAFLHDRRVQTVGFFSKGMLVVTSPEPLQQEALYLLEKFAGVFDLTYTRFSDLKIAEAHALQAEQDLIAIKEAKQKAEAALSELQVTQKQLIQSEKMASLGELTAGIAHEIQNPLNFVNNFSEVNTELIEELEQEVSKGNLEEVKLLTKDIKENEQKINHHGKRAGDIVKGMLQHSRSSSGVKEPTDINALADEYLRLAYHGLRAKDKSFNATMKTDFDETIGSISIIPQDIGRVILNLITNAFYAVNEKAKQNIVGYEPTVTVSTHRPPLLGRGAGGEVLIKVQDNGNGIPDSIKEKIFQPFFTTKPTGQGTGLGLSLSYDIVKTHGGELKVETKEAYRDEPARREAGATFVIQLPV